MKKKRSEEVTVVATEITPIEPRRVVLPGKLLVPKRHVMKERADTPFERPTGQFKAIKVRGEATLVEEVEE